ncbi:MAG: HAD family hydrolase [Clostridia bacterium]|nr:HAD family hydrolase [Clostridia bacterium]
MKNLIFDLDGTLWDSTKQIEIVWKKVSKQFNINTSNISIKSIMGMTNDEIIATLFSKDSKLGTAFIEKSQLEEVKYLSKYGGNIYPNTISTITQLKNNYNLYIVSNCQIGYIESFINYYKLQSLFKDFECSGNTNLPKSNNINILMKRNNISTAIYIGDTENDYKAAKEANISFIWASYGFGNCKKYDYKICDIKDLLDFNL